MERWKWADLSIWISVINVMAQDSTIRLKQMNQTELSGFVSQITSGILGISGTVVAPTGKLTGAFYPLNSNPRNYALSGDFISEQDLLSAISQENVYISENYYPLSNPSGFISAGGVSSESIVYTTGSQQINGFKTFIQDVRLESNLFGPHDGHGRDIWYIDEGGGYHCGTSYMGAYTLQSQGWFSAGEMDVIAAYLNSAGVISGKRLVIDELPLNSGLIQRSLPFTNMKFRADNTGMYYNGIINSDIPNLPMSSTTMVWFSKLDAIYPQKVKIYTKVPYKVTDNEDDYDTFIPLPDGSYLTKMRTTSFIGGRVKEYSLPIPTDLFLSFRTHQPISTYIINTDSTYFASKVMNVNLSFIRKSTIGLRCDIRVNFNGTPSGFRMDFYNYDDAVHTPYNQITGFVTTGGHHTKYLELFSTKGGKWKVLK